MVRLTINDNDAGQRLDRFLRKYLKNAPLSRIYKMIRKDVRLNGRKAGEDTMLFAGDILNIYISEEELARLTNGTGKKKAKKQFTVSYEDDNMLIVDKPKGLLVHGDAHEKKNTLVNQVMGYLQEKGEYDPSLEKTFTPAPVNRLDRNTTGLVIFGKNAAAARELTRLIRERDKIEKFYITIVCGTLKETLKLSGRLEKDGKRNISSIVDGMSGKDAVTIVRPLASGDDFSLAEIKLITGRTHQIRVHLAGEGFPLAGDPKYGVTMVNEKVKKYGVSTQLLHAYKLRFNCVSGPLAGLDGLTVEADPPPEFMRALEKLIPGCDRRYVTKRYDG